MKILTVIFVLIFSLSMFGQTDVTAPSFSNFGYFPGVIYIGSSAGNLNFSVSAADDASGVDLIRVHFRSPSGNQTIDVDFDASTRTSGDALNGQYNKTVIIPQTTETGVWTLEYLYIRDAAGNQKYTLTNELMALGFRTRLPISAVVCTYTLSQPSQDFPASGGNGVATVLTQIECSGSLTGTSWFVTANSVSGTANLSSGVLTITVPFSVAPNTGAARTGTITISGQIFTINQAGVTKSRTRVKFQ